MTLSAQPELLQDARRYIWWETPEEALRRPLRVIAQVMNIGDYDDVQRLIAAVGTGPFREAIQGAEPGWFSERSWTYWCYRLGLTAPGETVPGMPRRTYE